jgi:hypothetical protein
MMFLLGWLLATYGPVGTAALFWRLAKPSHVAWLFHLLLLPCAVVMLWGGGLLMASVVGDPDFDSTLGGPIIPALLLFFLAIFGYATALVCGHLSAKFARG